MLFKHVYHFFFQETDFIQFMSNPDQLSYTPPASNNDWSDPSLLNLNDLNFNDQLKKHEIVLVMFYAPWCGHCKKMKPEYVTAAKELSAEGRSKCLAMVDCTVNPDVTEKYNIEGFPTLKLFRHGTFVTDYKGPRTVEDIKKFVKPYFGSAKDEL